MNLAHLPDDLRTLNRSAMLALLQTHPTALARRAAAALRPSTPAPIADHWFVLLHCRLVARSTKRKLVFTSRGRAAAELIARAIAGESGIHHVTTTTGVDVAGECVCGWTRRFPIRGGAARLADAIKQHQAAAIAADLADQAEGLAHAQ